MNRKNYFSNFKSKETMVLEQLETQPKTIKIEGVWQAQDTINSSSFNSKMFIDLSEKWIEDLTAYETLEIHNNTINIIRKYKTEHFNFQFTSNGNMLLVEPNKSIWKIISHSENELLIERYINNFSYQTRFKKQ